MPGKYLFNRKQQRLEYLFFTPAGELCEVSGGELVSYRTPEGEPALAPIFETADKKQLVTCDLVPIVELAELDYVRHLRASELDEAERRYLSAQRLVKLRLLID